MKIVNFKSLLEVSYGRISSSAFDLLTGIRIKHGENWYLVGESCRNLGRNPHRIVNATPDEVDYQVLLAAGLLQCTQNVSEKVNLTVGFPFSTYNAYKGMAERLLSKRNFLIEFDTALYKKDGLIEKKMIEIDRFEIIPELAACAIGLKKMHQAPEDNFLVISLGFGTTEIGVVTPEGLNKRTIISVPGIIRCIKNLRDELEKDQFIGFITEHQLDDAFMNGSITINRNKINIKSLRSNILKSFYKEYISDTIRSVISDRDFDSIEKIYLVGGGTFYDEIRSSFLAEFENILPVAVLPNAEQMAAVGYYYNSQRISNSSETLSVGIDLGNSSSLVCYGN